MWTKHSIIQVLLPFGLASDERARLYSGLGQFVNLGDSADEFRKFRNLWPKFTPVEFRKGSRLGQSMHLTSDMHLLVIIFRDYMRRVWMSDPEADSRGFADILLGLQVEEANVPSESLGQLKPKGFLSLKSVIDSQVPYDGDQWHASPKVVTSWKFGDFNYFPLTDFQKAFYLLFRERWRAKICAQCSRYFIADKPAQRYCSTTCYGTARSKQALHWWRTKGDPRRKEQQLKKRRKKRSKRESNN